METNKWSLDCPYYDKSFNTLNGLINDIIETGMDPNYEIMENGLPAGETARDHIIL